MPTLAKETRGTSPAEYSSLPPADTEVHRHRELVQRVIASPAFARSERLSALLAFVCEMALAGREAELNEQKIGQAVFGRAPEYDSSADGIVRTQASRLRQRLDLFFEQEGREEPVRLVIPKGGYVPLFQPRAVLAELLPAVAIEPGETAEAKPVPDAVALPRRSILSWLPWLLCSLLAVALFWKGAPDRAHNPRATVLSHPLWSLVFLAGQPTLEIPGDSGLVLSYLVDRREVSLHDYLSGEYKVRTSSDGASFQHDLEAFKGELANRPYTSIVDLEAAVRLGQLAQAAHSSLQVRYARDIRPDDLRNHNVILIGAREANPWVELYEHSMNFVLQDDFRTTFSVWNKSPHPGEPSRWVSRTNDPEHRVYGVVAFLPNLSGDGNALLVEGTSMAGTEAAWDFVSDDAELLPFLQHIRRPNGSVPHFEGVVGTQNMNTRAVHTELITWRVLD